MAVIAIFCDGTWSDRDSNDPTHVARLASACAQTENQRVLYFAGVGAGTGMVSDLGRWLSKMGGGLFGWGLNRNIKTAYLELCRLYQPGDKIMIFGFSRGAYTARSLVGLIRKSGILASPTRQNLSRAFRLYRSRGASKAPDSPRVWAQRRQLSPDYATSAADVICRDDHSYLVRIAYVGVWDTVGALGIPKSILGRVGAMWNARYAFHDTSLSGLVEQARHAVALDERRVLFEPSLWDNLDTGALGPGLNQGNRGAARYYQQKWFVGSHAVVGGSSGPQDLAFAPLLWVWRGASENGLTEKPSHAPTDVPVNMAVVAPALYDVNRLYRLAPWLLQWRRGPSRIDDLHDSARLRASLVKDYRPLTLKRLLAGLFPAGGSALRL